MYLESPAMLAPYAMMAASDALEAILFKIQMGWRDEDINRKLKPESTKEILLVQDLLLKVS